VDKYLLEITNIVIMYIKVYQFVLIFNFMNEKYVTIKQAAKILGVSTLTLRNWDNSGKFPAGRHPISNYRVYRVEDVEQILLQMDVRIGGHKPSRKGVKKLIVQHIKDSE